MPRIKTRRNGKSPTLGDAPMPEPLSTAPTATKAPSPLSTESDQPNSGPTSVDPPLPTQTPIEPSLTPDILPFVIAQLDNKLDLDTLLVCQRVSRAGWEKATRKIYRDIVVKDWSKLFWMPDGTGSRLEVITGFSGRNRPPKWSPSARNSFRRRLVAFSFVTSIHLTCGTTTEAVSKTFYELIHIASRIFEGSKLWPTMQGDPNTPKAESIIFPSVRNLKVDPEGMVANYNPRSRDQVLLSLRMDMEQILAAAKPHPRAPALSSRPQSICLKLPRVSHEESDTFSFVRVSSMILVYSNFPEADVYLHNMTPDLGTITAFGAAATFHFMRPKSPEASADRAHSVGKATNYGLLLCLADGVRQRIMARKLSLHGDVSICSNPRWIISGEARYSTTEDESSLRDLIRSTADTVITVASGFGMNAGDFVRIDSETEAGIDQLRFRYPGHEAVCPVCGCSE